MATATLTGAMGGASGDVQVWLAHTGERCPVTAGARPLRRERGGVARGGQVKFTFADLGIDHFQICAQFPGDARYKAANAGPVDLFVIKGALLASPSVAMQRPLRSRRTASSQHR